MSDIALIIFLFLLTTWITSPNVILFNFFRKSPKKTETASPGINWKMKKFTALSFSTGGKEVDANVTKIINSCKAADKKVKKMDLITKQNISRKRNLLRVNFSCFYGHISLKVKIFFWDISKNHPWSLKDLKEQLFQ